ncbi:hypothetical protein AVEN_253104-1 [Araneus ventricosus]|uniref:Uncharacterized protein n=1 Tax=Araneus ventricosus TaxID=182803 RepID=A0A4Y2TYK2_ARAVE|nr:hypothetical protein AVEN_253104-1 [Araneus ventricosus]
MGRGGLVVRSGLRSQRPSISRTDSNEDPTCLWAWFTLTRDGTSYGVVTLAYCGICVHFIKLYINDLLTTGYVTDENKGKFCNILKDVSNRQIR